MLHSKRMNSRFSKKTKRRLIILGGIAALFGLFLLLLPIGVRWGAAKWLTDQGVVTQIEDIDLNLFTGRLAISKAHGENAQGKGFNIDHALVNLNYASLFAKQIYLTNLDLRNSRVDVRIDEAGKLSVAGLPITGSEPEEAPEEESTPWGFGLERAAIGALTLRYEQPEFAREITLSSSSTSDLATWEPNQPFPLDAALSIGDSKIKLDGQLRPFGERIRGDITLGIQNFDLDMVAPLAKQQGIARLAGVINGALDITLDYQADQGLQLAVEGGTKLAGANVAMPQLQLNNADVDWQGKIQAQLLQRDGGTDQVTADGRLSVNKVDMMLPGTLAFQQQKTGWQGNVVARLGEPMSLTADGELNLAETHLDLFESSASDANPPVAPPDDAPETAEDTPGEQAEEVPEPPPAQAESAASQQPKILTLDQGQTSWKGNIAARFGKTSSIETNGLFTLDKTRLVLPGQLDLAQGTLRWSGKLDTTLNDQGPSIDAQGELNTESTALSLPGNGIDLIQQALTWKGSADYAPGDPALVHADGGLQAQGLDLNLAQQKLAIAGERIAWTGNLALDPNAEGLPEKSELPLKLTGKLDGGGLLIRDTALGKALARVGEFAINDIAITGLDDIRSASASVGAIAALEREKNAPRLDEYPYIAAIKNVSLENITFTGQSRLALGNVNINGINALLYRAPKEPAWEAAQWFGAAAEASGEPAPPAEVEPETRANSESSFQIALERGQVAESQLTIDDRGVSPAFETDLSGLRITLADLDSAKPAQGSALDIFSALGRYGSIKASGIINPFLEPPSADITGKINAVNLAPISGYTAQAIDRRIDQGTFSADLKFNLDRGEIDANAELTLTQLRIGGAQTESGIVQKKLGLPLNKILSLLRDGDGNITLDLPVGGNLENPSFSILQIVRDAIFNSLRKAVLVIYSPLKLGKGLIDLATALRLDPVLYPPGKAELDDTDQTFLDKVAQKLSDRPNTEFIVCGHAVPADRTALNLAEADAPVAEGDTAPTPEQLSAARDAMFKLASERTSLIGDYFVSKNIASSRLVLCNPALGEPDDALPRTSLSF